MASRIALALVVAALVGGCGRQELWKPGATGGATGSAGVAATAGTSGGTGTSGGGGSGTAGASAGAGGATRPFDDGFDPRTLPGTTLWLDAGKNVNEDTGNSVHSWEDQVAAQVAIGTAPLPWYEASGPGGHPEVVFQPFAMLATPPGGGVSLGAGDFLIEVVSSWNGGTKDTPEMLALDKGTDHDFTLAPNGVGAFYASLAGASTVVSLGRYDDRKLHVFGARRTGAGDGTTLALRADGALEHMMTEAAYARDLSPLAELLLGPDVAIAEIIIVRGTLADADLARIESHLLSKYGLR